jgi:hypothetical protein
MGKAVLTALFAVSGYNVSAAITVDQITPAELGTISCSATAAFLSANACVGMVIDPNNDTGGNANNPSNETILVSYLNGETITANGTTAAGYIGTVGGGDAWGTQGDWDGIGSEIQAASLPPTGSVSSGQLSVTKDTGTLKSGSFTFDSTSLGKYIDQFVFNVKGSAGWSSYYYDLSGQQLTTLNDIWDTKGLVNNGGNQPDISHIYGAFILGDDISTDPPEPMPLPGTLLLVGLGLLGVRFARKA